MKENGVDDEPPMPLVGGGPAGVVDPKRFEVGLLAGVVLDDVLRLNMEPPWGLMAEPKGFAFCAGLLEASLFGVWKLKGADEVAALAGCVAWEKEKLDLKEAVPGGAVLVLDGCPKLVDEESVLLPPAKALNTLPPPVAGVVLPNRPPPPAEVLVGMLPKRPPTPPPAAVLVGVLPKRPPPPEEVAGVLPKRPVPLVAPDGLLPKRPPPPDVAGGFGADPNSPPDGG